jgi:putative flippase GtrA
MEPAVPAVSGGPLSRLRNRPIVRKLFKYSMVSVVGVITGQSTLIFCKAVLGWPGVASNLMAVTTGSIPSYLLNRYWVWQKSGPNRFRTEVLPFWVMSVLGLITSTLFVAYADHRWGTTIAVSIANLAGFGILWLGKFFVLDRVLFVTPQA